MRAMAASSAQVWGLGAKALAERIARGELRALDVVDAHVARIEEVNSRINAVVWTRYDEARAEAREIDRRRAEGRPLGPLAGVPITAYASSSDAAMAYRALASEILEHV